MDTSHTQRLLKNAVIDNFFFSDKMSDTTTALLTADIDPLDPATQTVDNGLMRAVKDCASGTDLVLKNLRFQPFDTVKVVCGAF